MRTSSSTSPTAERMSSARGSLKKSRWSEYPACRAAVPAGSPPQRAVPLPPPLWACRFLCFDAFGGSVVLVD
eukprot:m.216058 g.216058  ORF g.216058 m.216058 type:complete len:72 (+) comp54092_c1_seq1:458-673(+)